MDNIPITQEHILDLPEELYEIFNTKQVKLYNKHQMVYRQGEAAEGFYFLKSGKIKVFVNSPEGLEKNLAVYNRGDVFGEASFFDGYPRISSAKAITDCEIIMMDKSDLLDLFKKKPLLALKFIETLSKKVRMLSNEIDSMSFLAADKRIAGFLLELSQSLNGEIEISQEDIGVAVGVSRVTVSRVLGSFAAKGWIKTMYKKILIMDHDALLNFTRT
ncbi:Crp/Fnr family transcriptional regulator [Alkalibacter saccharofermentans]|uniref:Crp-like helix-turn-helix domain-containing protein n=1 Tax=Alkalibacter saccharofermentans DSM 14828 TaxID=1120975 RepID=A0A1M4TCG8_9FIRM|nr:Crp/Fnr family transcriptional regulator [Alkalibacter saccharofermentans]SHE42048.1 Crp-like helix-turn-helix domain-containing protein [Alkalibacter saccharofermentans DSM 14828]